MRKKDVIDYFKGTNATARAIREAGWQCSGSVVSYWDDDYPVPELSAWRIWWITDGEVKLRLEDYWALAAERDAASDRRTKKKRRAA